MLHFFQQLFLVLAVFIRENKYQQARLFVQINQIRVPVEKTAALGTAKQIQFPAEYGVSEFGVLGYVYKRPAVRFKRFAAVGASHSFGKFKGSHSFFIAYTEGIVAKKLTKHEK